VSAGTVSFDQLATSADLTAVKYNTDLNRVYQKVNSSIQTDNIENDTLTEADMADEINPRVRTYEGASCQFVYTGLLPVTGASLTTNISAGTAYPMGYRVVKSSATPKTYTASKWTWVDIDQNGDFQYSEASIGGATPAVASNSIRLARVSSDGTTVNTVTDLRTTSCTSGPFSNIADATGEADLGDILSNGQSGWTSGLNPVTQDATSVYVLPGSARINGEYRSSAASISVPTTAGNSLTGVHGLDAGSLAANTTYYVYATADVDGVTSPTILLSTSASAPAGATNYRRVGEVKTALGTATLVSADTYGVSSLGKIVQRKLITTNEYATFATTIPNDDTPPTSSEGGLIVSGDITIVSANNDIVIDGMFHLGEVTDTGSVASLCVFQDEDQNPVVCARGQLTDGNPAYYPTPIVLPKIRMTGLSVGKHTFNVRAGNDTGAIALNGGGTRVLGGKLYSGLTLTEETR